jgi:hypothetical protein
MEPVDPSRKHFYISMVKSVIRLLGCWCLFQAGITVYEGGNAGALLILTAFAFAAAEGLGIVEEL